MRNSPPSLGVSVGWGDGGMEGWRRGSGGPTRCPRHNRGLSAAGVLWPLGGSLSSVLHGSSTMTALFRRYYCAPGGSPWTTAHLCLCTRARAPTAARTEIGLNTSGTSSAMAVSRSPARRFYCPRFASRHPSRKKLLVIPTPSDPEPTSRPSRSSGRCSEL